MKKSETEMMKTFVKLAEKVKVFIDKIEKKNEKTTPFKNKLDQINSEKNVKEPSKNNKPTGNDIEKISISDSENSNKDSKDEDYNTRKKIMVRKEIINLIPNSKLSYHKKNLL